MSHAPTDMEPHQHARLLLALGEDDFDAIVDSCETSPETIAEEFGAYMADQRSWPDVTGTDRLLRAFRDLDTSGIVARADFTCCQNCGIEEIGGEVPEGERRRGYVFCHRQDMETAVRDGSLWLAYGVFVDAAEPSTQAEIGEDVAAALRRYGLTVNWSGDPGKRIEVDLTWRRRRFGDLATWPGGPAPSDPGPDRLDVSYCDYTRNRFHDDPVPMTPAEARGVLLGLTPCPDNFAAFDGRSGETVQVTWEEGPRLWLEIPDPSARRTHGRHVTPAEAEELMMILATEDRAPLDRLSGYTTELWP